MRSTTSFVESQPCFSQDTPRPSASNSSLAPQAKPSDPLQSCWCLIAISVFSTRVHRHLEHGGRAGPVQPWLRTTVDGATNSGTRGFPPTTTTTTPQMMVSPSRPEWEGHMASLTWGAGWKKTSSLFAVAEWDYQDDAPWRFRYLEVENRLPTPSASPSCFLPPAGRGGQLHLHVGEEGGGPTVTRSTESDRARPAADVLWRIGAADSTEFRDKLPACGSGEGRRLARLPNSTRGTPVRSGGAQDVLDSPAGST